VQETPTARAPPAAGVQKAAAADVVNQSAKDDPQVTAMCAAVTPGATLTAHQLRRLDACCMLSHRAKHSLCCFCRHLRMLRGRRQHRCSTTSSSILRWPPASWRQVCTGEAMKHSIARFQCSLGQLRCSVSKGTPGQRRLGLQQNFMSALRSTLAQPNSVGLGRSLMLLAISVHHSHQH
jgi:hypothetical protein